MTREEERIALITQRLQALDPSQLSIRNDTHQHAGHNPAHDGANHFTVVMESAQFDGLTLLARQRKVYALLQDLMPFPIHALSLKLTVPPKSTEL